MVRKKYKEKTSKKLNQEPERLVANQVYSLLLKTIRAIAILSKMHVFTVSSFLKSVYGLSCSLFTKYKHIHIL